MKGLFISILLVLSGLNVSAQGPSGDWVGDTIGIWTVISFEDPTTDIRIEPSPQNIWEIGVPQKTFFNQAYTVPNAIITGATGSYPAGNLSSFDLYIYAENTNFFYPWAFFLDFRHKFDTDTLHDGGFISVSWDKGATFNNILTDTLSLLWNISPYVGGWYPYGNTNLYDTTGVLANGEPGFSGHSGGWVQTSLAWYYIPVKDWFEVPDTMILRFNFYSDDIPETREGWMIDQIRLFSIDLGSGTGDLAKSGHRAKIAPNPLITTTRVLLDKPYPMTRYRFTDLAGRMISEGMHEHCSAFVLQRNGIKPGIYLLTIWPGDNPAETHKVIVSQPSGAEPN
jgi:hypothetical protein